MAFHVIVSLFTYEFESIDNDPKPIFRKDLFSAYAVYLLCIFDSYRQDLLNICRLRFHLCSAFSR